MDMSEWLEQNVRVRGEVEKELEDMGVLAYAVTETSVVFIMTNGKLLKVEGFFYPEGGFMELNGRYLPTLAD